MEPLITATAAKKLANNLLLPLVKTSVPGIFNRASASVKRNAALDDNFFDRAGLISCFERLGSCPISVEEFEKFFHAETWQRIFTAAVAARALGDDSVRLKLAQEIASEVEAAFPHLGSRRAKETAIELEQSLHEVCSRCWNAAQAEGHISPIDFTADSARRFLIDEVESVIRQLKAKRLYSAEQIELNERFAGRYLQQVGKHYKKITPPSTADSVAVDINKIYVPCDFISTDIELTNNEPETTITYEQLLSKTYRTVILGTPGAGKSTFLRKICFDLWSQPRCCPVGYGKVVPILIVLREYGRKKKDEGLSILEYIAQSIRSELQLDDMPKDFLEYLLSSGRALFLFDGLDELLEISERSSVRDAVQLFASSNPGTPIVVTARQVGYEQAPLSREMFRAYRLTSFSRDQVEQYCRNWFSLHEDKNLEQHEQSVRSFVRESESVNDLRSNALLLALMCNLYKQDGYLPRNRPSVYTRCADLLFEKWDKHRGIKAAIPSEYLLRPAIMGLAHWIYSDSKLREGVSEAILIAKTAEILKKNFLNLKRRRCTLRVNSSSFVEGVLGSLLIRDQLKLNRCINLPMQPFLNSLQRKCLFQFQKTYGSSCFRSFLKFNPANGI